MIHRRHVYDDTVGVGEPLNEIAYGQGLVLRGKHYLVVEPPECSARHHRRVAQEIFMSPLTTYALPSLSYDDYSKYFRQTWSAVNDSLPYNVHLLTLDQWTAKVFLVRVEHYFEKNEDATYSAPVQLDLQMLFHSIGRIAELVELTLTGNLPLSEMQRLVWRTDRNESSSRNPTGDSSPASSAKVLENSTMVTLNPMEIRTFQVTVQ